MHMTSPSKIVDLTRHLPDEDIPLHDTARAELDDGDNTPVTASEEALESAGYDEVVYEEDDLRGRRWTALLRLFSSV